MKRGRLLVNLERSSDSALKPTQCSHANGRNSADACCATSPPDQARRLVITAVGSLCELFARVAATHPCSRPALTGGERHRVYAWAPRPGRRSPSAAGPEPGSRSPTPRAPGGSRGMVGGKIGELSMRETSAPRARRWDRLVEAPTAFGGGSGRRVATSDSAGAQRPETAAKPGHDAGPDLTMGAAMAGVVSAPVLGLALTRRQRHRP